LAVGVTFFYIAAKSHPFPAEFEHEMGSLLQDTEIDFEKIKENRKESSQDVNLFIRFLRKLLRKEPSERTTI
jgi:serine/threonine protein kinase